jgi:signal peptidase II
VRLLLLFAGSTTIMSELKSEEDGARPSSGRAFSSCVGKEPLRSVGLPDYKAQLIFWSILVLGLILDLWSKRAVFEWLGQKPGSTVTLIAGLLRLIIAENAGAAFGIATGQRYLLVAMSVIALIVVFGVFLFSRACQGRSMHIALGLFAAGVCGNLYDRIFNDGLVRDFIDVVYWHGRHWPAFNVADSMLCIGIGLMIVSGLFIGKSSRRRAQLHK